jgi:hypothetical protein
MILCEDTSINNSREREKVFATTNKCANSSHNDIRRRNKGVLSDRFVTSHDDIFCSYGKDQSTELQDRTLIEKIRVEINIVIVSRSLDENIVSRIDDHEVISAWFN